MASYFLILGLIMTVAWVYCVINTFTQEGLGGAIMLIAAVILLPGPFYLVAGIFDFTKASGTLFVYKVVRFFLFAFAACFIIYHIVCSFYDRGYLAGIVIDLIVFWILYAPVQKRLDPKTVVSENNKRIEQDLEMWGHVPFRVNVPRNFKIVSKLEHSDPEEDCGTAIYLDEEGVKHLPGIEDQIFIGTKPNDALKDRQHILQDRLTFADERFHGFELYEDFMVLKTDQITVNGVEGVRNVGKARHYENFREVFLYSVVFFGAENYYVFAAAADLSRREKYEPIYNQIIQSFREVKPSVI